MLPTLIANSEHHDARRARWRKGADVGKIQVECHDHARFCQTMLRQNWIIAAANAFLMNRLCVVARAEKQRRDIVVQILVDFETHQAAVGVKGMTVSRASSAAY